MVLFCLSLSCLVSSGLTPTALQTISDMGLRIIYNPEESACFYEAIAQQAGTNAQNLRRGLREHMVLLMQNPAISEHNQLQSALSQYPLFSSLDELINFYLSGALTRHGEQGELMLLPFIVKVLKQPILVLNGSHHGMAEMPHFLISLDLFATVVYDSVQAQALITPETIVLVYADNTFYGAQQTTEGVHWDTLFNQLQALFINEFGNFYRGTPRRYFRRDPNGYLIPSTSGSGYQLPDNFDPQQSAAIPGIDYPTPFSIRMVRRSAEHRDDSLETPAVEFLISTQQTSLDGYYFHNPDNYQLLLMHQIEEFYQDHSFARRQASFSQVEVADDELPDSRPNRVSVTSQNSGASSQDRHRRISQISSGSSDSQSQETQVQARVRQYEMNQHRRDQYQRDITVRGRDAKILNEEGSKRFKKLWKKSRRKISLTINFSKRLDPYKAYATSRKTSSGVPTSFRWKLSKSSESIGWVFGNRFVSSDAKFYLERNAATKNYHIKMKTSVQTGMGSLVPTTPDLGKDAIKSPGGQEIARRQLNDAIVAGHATVIDLYIPDENLRILELSPEADITTTKRVDGIATLKEVHMLEKKPGTHDLYLQRAPDETDWAVFWKKEGHMTRAQVVSDADGRVITADLDPILIAFQLEELDLSGRDKLPLPLITHKPVRQRIARLKQKLATLKPLPGCTVGVHEYQHLAESIKFLEIGMDDFFDTWIFVETTEYTPNGSINVELINAAALSIQAAINPRIPVLADLPAHCQNFPCFSVNWHSDTEEEPSIHGYWIRAPLEHPDMGNVNQRAIELVHLMNEALGRTDNPAVHHNHDAHSPASNPLANYPADIYIPRDLGVDDEDQETILYHRGSTSIENEEEMAKLIRTCKNNQLFVTINHPLWPGLRHIYSKRWLTACSAVESLMIRRTSYGSTVRRKESATD